MSADDSLIISRRKLLHGAATLAIGGAAGPLALPVARSAAAPAPLGKPIDPKDLIIAFVLRARACHDGGNSGNCGSASRITYHGALLAT
jgi:hypothetical protein